MLPTGKLKRQISPAIPVFKAISSELSSNAWGDIYCQLNYSFHADMSFERRQVQIIPSWKN